MTHGPGKKDRERSAELEAMFIALVQSLSKERVHFVLFYATESPEKDGASLSGFVTSLPKQWYQETGHEFGELIRVWLVRHVHTPFPEEMLVREFDGTLRESKVGQS